MLRAHSRTHTMILRCGMRYLNRPWHTHITHTYTYNNYIGHKYTKLETKESMARVAVDCRGLRKKKRPGNNQQQPPAWEKRTQRRQRQKADGAQRVYRIEANEMWQRKIENGKPKVSSEENFLFEMQSDVEMSKPDSAEACCGDIFNVGWFSCTKHDSHRSFHLHTHTHT